MMHEDTYAPRCDVVGESDSYMPTFLHTVPAESVQEYLVNSHAPRQPVANQRNPRICTDRPRQTSKSIESPKKSPCFDPPSHLTRVGVVAIQLQSGRTPHRHPRECMTACASDVALHRCPRLWLASNKEGGIQKRKPSRRCSTGGFAAQAMMPSNSEAPDNNRPSAVATPARQQQRGTFLDSATMRKRCHSREMENQMTQRRRLERPWHRF
jgi:hypothetical protein